MKKIMIFTLTAFFYCMITAAYAEKICNINYGWAGHLIHKKDMSGRLNPIMTMHVYANFANPKNRFMTIQYRGKRIARESKIYPKLDMNTHNFSVSNIELSYGIFQNGKNWFMHGQFDCVNHGKEMIMHGFIKNEHELYRGVLLVLKRIQ